MAQTTRSLATLKIKDHRRARFSGTGWAAWAEACGQWTSLIVDITIIRYLGLSCRHPSSSGHSFLLSGTETKLSVGPRAPSYSLLQSAPAASALQHKAGGGDRFRTPLSPPPAVWV